MKPSHLLALLGTSLCLLTLSGCNLLPEPSADPTRYYTLSLPSDLDSALPANSKALRLGLRQVELSPYLKKGVLIVRKGENEILPNDYERWGEPLEAGLSRLLQLSLQADPRIAKVSVPPFRIENPLDYEVLVRIRRAEGLRPEVEGSGLRFVAVIELYSSGLKTELITQKAFIAPSQPWDGKDYAALAKGLSMDVQQLAGEIAALLPSSEPPK